MQLQFYNVSIVYRGCLRFSSVSEDPTGSLKKKERSNTLTEHGAFRSRQKLLESLEVLANKNCFRVDLQSFALLRALTVLVTPSYSFPKEALSVQIRGTRVVQVSPAL